MVHLERDSPWQFFKTLIYSDYIGKDREILKDLVKDIGIGSFIFILLIIIIFAILLTILAYFLSVIWVIVGLLMIVIAYVRHSKSPWLMQMYAMLLGFTMGPWYLVWIILKSVVLYM